MVLLLIACTGLNPIGKTRRASPEATDSAADSGPDSGAVDSVSTDSAAADSAGEDTAIDSGGTDSAAETGDTASSSPAEVCYLGEDEAGTTCLALVDWDASWGSDYDYPEPYEGSEQYSAPARFIDLSTVDPSLMLAPNFALDELMQESKGQYALFQTHVVEWLQAIRDDTGGAIYVNSGYRNVNYNEGVGGADYSRHMYGDGVDITSAVADLDELATICEDFGADYTQLYEAHVHCDWRDDALDPAFYDVSYAHRPAPRPEPTAALVCGPSGWTAPATGFDEGEPLRRWVATDAAGRVIARASGRIFPVPEGAARLEVRVGARIRLVQDLLGE